MALLLFQNPSGFGAQVSENGKSSAGKIMITSTEMHPNPADGHVHNYDDFSSVTFNEHTNFVNGVNNSSVVADLKLEARNSGTTTPAVRIDDAAGTTQGNPNDYGTIIKVKIVPGSPSEYVGQHVQVTVGYSYTELRAGSNAGEGAITSSYRLIVKPENWGPGTGTLFNSLNQFVLNPDSIKGSEIFNAKIGDTLTLRADTALNGTLNPGSVNSELQISLSVSDKP